MSTDDTRQSSPSLSDRAGSLLAAAMRRDPDAFASLAEPHRPALRVHCYRMLGSFSDAEDAVQDTMENAWRAITRFQPRAAFHRWLHAIATNVCLTHLRRRADKDPILSPYPDLLLVADEDDSTDPARVAERSADVSIAYLAALRVLPPRQRAALVLHDALDWPVREIASCLDATTASVNSLLQRARARIRSESAAGRLPPPHQPASHALEQRLVARFVEAWHSCDAAALTALLAADVILTAPPRPFICHGPAEVIEFFRGLRDDSRFDRIAVKATRANNQPAIADYFEHPSQTGTHTAHGVMVLTVINRKIAAITGFDDPRIFPALALPATLVDTHPG